jgi:hypothetical protein
MRREPGIGVTDLANPRDPVRVGTGPDAGDERYDEVPALDELLDDEAGGIQRQQLGDARPQRGGRRAPPRPT